MRLQARRAPQRPPTSARPGPAKASSGTRVRRVIVGASGSPSSLQVLRYAQHLARDHDATLVPVLAWLPPDGDLADRRTPCEELRRLWTQHACQRLQNALTLAWGAARRSAGPGRRPARAARPGPGQCRLPPRRPTGSGGRPPGRPDPDRGRPGEPLLPWPTPSALSLPSRPPRSPGKRGVERSGTGCSPPTRSRRKHAAANRQAHPPAHRDLQADQHPSWLNAHHGRTRR